MRLQNFGDQCAVDGMSDETFKSTMVECIQLLAKFLQERIEECPCFIHILDKSLNQIFLEPDKFVKNDDHKKCCVRIFPPNSEEEIKEYQEVFQKHPQSAGLCSCTPLDLCMQTNHMLDNVTREIIYNLLFCLFQSYRFKQYLTLSLTANYSSIICKTADSEHDIASIGVQVFTSDEMSMLIYKNPDLRNNILTQFWSTIRDMRQAPENEDNYYQMFKVLHDIKYIARPDCLKYCVEQTDFIERFITILGHFYFIDTKKRRTTMVTYMQEGSINDRILNLESYVIRIGIQYLKEIPVSDVQKNQLILNAFRKCFDEIKSAMKAKDCESHGFYNLPAHRLFAYYLTRLLIYKRIEIRRNQAQNAEFSNLSLQQSFRKVLLEYVPQNARVIKGKAKSATGTAAKGKEIQAKKEKEKEKKEGEDLGGMHDDGDLDEMGAILGGSESKQLQEPLLKSSLADEEGDADVFSQNAPSDGQDDLDANQFIDELLQTVILPLILSSSFVHEIEARKWVYHGLYLE